MPEHASLALGFCIMLMLVMVLTWCLLMLELLFRALGAPPVTPVLVRWLRGGVVEVVVAVGVVVAAWGSHSYFDEPGPEMLSQRIYPEDLIVLSVTESMKDSIRRAPDDARLVEYLHEGQPTGMYFKLPIRGTSSEVLLPRDLRVATGGMRAVTQSVFSHNSADDTGITIRLHEAEYFDPGFLAAHSWRVRISSMPEDWPEGYLLEVEVLEARGGTKTLVRELPCWVFLYQ